MDNNYKSQQKFYSLQQKAIKDTLYTYNSDNLQDYTDRSSGSFNNQKNKDINQDYIQNTDWDKEADYHNSYYVNGKLNKGRTIKLKK